MKIVEAGMTSEKFANRDRLTVRGRFYWRRDEWIRHVLCVPKSDLSATGKLVGIFVVQTLSANDQTWVTSQKTIASKMGLSVQTVANAICDLKALGLLETKKMKFKDVTFAMNRYEMIDPVHALPRKRTKRQRLT